MQNTLSSTIQELAAKRDIKFGATDQGRAWCLKALHPSDAIVMPTGVPDETNFPVVQTSYNLVYDLATQATGNWSPTLCIMPDPIAPICYCQDATVLEPSTWYGVLNSQVGGQDPNSANYTAGREFFQTAYQKWRMIAMSVTVCQDAAATSNEGTCVAYQSTYTYSKFAASPWQTVSKSAIDMPLSEEELHKEEEVSKPLADLRKFKKSLEKVPEREDRKSIGTTSATQVYASEQIVAFHAQEIPFQQTDPYVVGSNMPGVYTGKAVDGVYMPIKLNRCALEWKDASDNKMLGSYFDPTTNLGYQELPLTSSAALPYDCFPFGMGTYLNYASSTYVGAPAGYSQALKPLNGSFGIISFHNLAQTTNLQVTVRMVLETQVLPASILSSQQSMGPPVDLLAIDNYFAISKLMKDAYPANYNSWDKLIGVIRNVAKVALPALSAVPGIPGLIGKGLSMLAPVAESIFETNSKSANNAQKAIAADERRIAKSQVTSAQKKIAQVSSTTSVPKKKRTRKPRPVSTLPPSPGYVQIDGKWYAPA